MIGSRDARLPDALLDRALASRLAVVALDNVAREYPNKLDHLMTSAADVAAPAALHPVFYGSYDWHSSVHMHWTLVTLLAHFPDLPEADAVAARLDVHFTTERVAGELAYLERPSAAAFERPYGWAWLLALQAALVRAARADPRAAPWRDRLQPLADRFVARVTAFLPRAAYPSRAGSHANSAFAALLMLDYATTVDDRSLDDALTAQARRWYGADRDYPVAYETSSEDFLSNGLLEAALMRRVLDAGDGPHAFADWWHAFVPDESRLLHWLVPVTPSDRSDARLTHMDGLNFSRAWCWTLLLDALPPSLHEAVARAIDAQRRASLPEAARGHYVNTHWLASFALLALGA